MNTKTDASPAADDGGSAAQLPAKKPRLAIFIATAGGLGYAPKAPGTLGSLVGPLLAILPWWTFLIVGFLFKNEQLLPHVPYGGFDPFLLTQIWIWLVVAVAGVWAASRAARYWSQKDPQRVVIDEVSGQHLALFLGCALPLRWAFGPSAQGTDPDIGFVTSSTVLTWKYLLVGFILFRLFDIWKPFPARQAESLPGGWGIMTDDWVAGIYAGIGLWLARAAGL